ncbi:MAG: hypothetical protein AB2754_20865, partial [Candidatus Thiodiazotropha endolucinida]
VDPLDLQLHGGGTVFAENFQFSHVIRFVLALMGRPTLGRGRESDGRVYREWGEEVNPGFSGAPRRTLRVHNIAWGAACRTVPL